MSEKHVTSTAGREVQSAPPAPQAPVRVSGATGVNSLTAGQLPKLFTPAAIVVSLAVAAGVLALIGRPNPALIAVLGAVIYLFLTWIAAFLVESPRRAKDRIMAGLFVMCFLIALAPLVSLIVQTLVDGTRRLDALYFSNSMRNVVGDGGGAIHAIYGTLIVTGITTLISVPIGLLCAVYLVEYGAKNRLARAITFFVDVMTGIPSIVAGLFAYALFGLLFGAGSVSGMAGAAALSILMIPTIVRSAEEYLRIVPNELREASYALGVPKWRTIVKVVLPTAIAGIVTGVILAIARVIGETAPLLVTMGATDSVNTNPVRNAMMTLPVFVYYQYMQPGNPPQAYVDRAWAGALTLIAIVMLLNGIGRFIAYKFAPKAR